MEIISEVDILHEVISHNQVNNLLIEYSCLIIHWCVPIYLTTFSLKFHTQSDLFAKHFAYNLK